MSDAISSNPVDTALVAELKRLAQHYGGYVGDQLGNAALRIEGLRAEVLKLESHIVDVYNAQEAKQVETSDDSRDAARYRWLRRRIARTIIARIAGAEPETEWASRPEALDGLIDTGIAESGSKSDPLADVRWICGSCTTVNGIDDEACLGCRKSREEHDRRALKSEGKQREHCNRSSW